MYIASGMKTYASLLASEARAKWESDFNAAYIQQLIMVSSAVDFKLLSGIHKIVPFSSHLKCCQLDNYHLQQLEEEFEKATTLILEDSSEG